MFTQSLIALLINFNVIVTFTDFQYCKAISSNSNRFFLKNKIKIESTKYSRMCSMMAHNHHTELNTISIILLEISFLIKKNKIANIKHIYDCIMNTSANYSLYQTHKMCFIFTF